MNFLHVATLINLFSLLFGCVESVTIVSWTRGQNQLDARFVTIDASTGRVLTNTSTRLTPSQIAVTIKGDVYYKDLNDMQEFLPSNSSIQYKFDCGYGTDMWIFGYSTQLSELVVILKSWNDQITALPNAPFYNTIFKLPAGTFFQSYPPWAIYDDLTSRLYYPISSPNQTQWAIFDVVAQKLIQAYTYQSLPQVCWNAVVNRHASYDSVYCNNDKGQLFEMDLRTTTFTLLSVDVRKYFNTNAGYILAGTMDDVNNVWYGTVSTPDGYGIMAVDMSSYQITMVGPIQKQFQYVTLSIYHGD